MRKTARIGITATASPFVRETAERIETLAGELFTDDPPELVFHPNAFLVHKHFAGEDAARTESFLALANAPDIDAVWFARGGYGSCRMAEAALAKLEAPAFEKVYLGYSDAGLLLAGLYKAGCRVAHGPMCQDIVRENGGAAVARALRWLVSRDPETREPSLASDDHPAAAFNMITLSQLLGTPLEPDLAGHVLMLEEVSEHLYRIDRSLHHILMNETLRGIAGLRLGRCSDTLENDVDFGETPESMARYWCVKAGIPFLGSADIGHDADNKIVPFGKWY